MDLTSRWRTWYEDWQRSSAFERSVRRSGRAAFHLQARPTVGRHTTLREVMAAAARLVQGLARAAATTRLPDRARLRAQAVPALRLAWRTALRGAAGTGAAIVAAAALASMPLAQGYGLYDEAQIDARLAQRRGSPILAEGGTQLMGVVFPQAAVNHADHGFLPMPGPLPETYRAVVLHLEHRSLFDPWRTICGIDPGAVLLRNVSGEGGGSGVPQQATKALLEPDRKKQGNRLQHYWHKLVEMGAACRLTLARGPEAVLRLYAEMAPLAQGAGTTRGLYAGAWTVFGVPPEGLTDAQQAILGAAHQVPLARVREAEFASGCETLLQPGQPASARNQCRVLRRARVGLKGVLPSGERLDRALAETAAYERTGIVFANDFGVSDEKGRLVNLSARNRAVLGEPLVARIADEARALAQAPGDPLNLSLGADLPARRASVSRAAAGVDAVAPWRSGLCVGLDAALPQRRCAGAPEAPAQALAVLARMDVRTGGLTALYESSPLAWNARHSGGSVLKMVIYVAALRAGWQPDDELCPRQASDGNRRLRRTTEPVFGFEQCSERQHVTLRDAAARSDSLVFYELARQLGDDRLEEALAVLGLKHDPLAGALPYALAFGTLGLTARDMLAMGQQIAAVAYGQSVQGLGPRLLVNGLAQAQVVPLRNYLGPVPEAAAHLRMLFEAPVSQPGGTLAAWQGQLSAGKTGTTSSALAPAPDARPYVAGKFVLGFDARSGEVVLVSVNAPHPHALGHDNLPAATFLPLLAALGR